MGESELRTALQCEGEVHVRRVWQEAETIVSERRKQAEAELELLRKQNDRQIHAEKTIMRSNLIFEAQTRALKCRLHAETVIEKRLLQAAGQLLSEMASEGRYVLWQKLCAELPAAEWVQVITHPEDLALAKQDFPRAKTEQDAELAGGMIVATRGGKVRIDNSLRCRLRRAWPDILPKLMRALSKEVAEDETASANIST